MPFLQDSLRLWVRLGVLDVALPFILISTVVYAVLQRTRILGEERGEPRKRLNIIVAVSIALISVAALRTVKSISIIAQYSALALVIIAMFWLIIGLLGIKGFKNKSVPGIIGIIFVFLIGIYALGAWDWVRFQWLDNYVLGTVISIVLFFLLVRFMTAEAPKAKESKPAAPKSSSRIADQGAPGEVQDYE